MERIRAFNHCETVIVAHAEKGRTRVEEIKEASKRVNRRDACEFNRGKRIHFRSCDKTLMSLEPESRDFSMKVSQAIEEWYCEEASELKH